MLGTDLAASDFVFDDEGLSALPTAVACWQGLSRSVGSMWALGSWTASSLEGVPRGERWHHSLLNRSSAPVPAGAYGDETTLSRAYRYVMEDVADLYEAAAHPADDDDELPPSRHALGYATQVISQIIGAYPPPEVTARESGTILLLWHDEHGFVSIEIGDEEFGLVGSRVGYPSVYINDRNEHLRSQIPRRALPRAGWSTGVSAIVKVADSWSSTNALTAIERDSEHGVASS